VDDLKDAFDENEVTLETKFSPQATPLENYRPLACFPELYRYLTDADLVLSNDITIQKNYRFNMERNTHIYDDENGNTWEFDYDTQKWVPYLEDKLIEQQQSAYGTAPDTTAEDLAENERKRKWKEEMESLNPNKEEPPLKKIKKKKKGQTQEQQTQQPFNSSIYVTGLPTDLSMTELLQYFEKKCGQVKLDSVTAEPKAKFYLDENKKPRGDALITFFKAPSVDLAITLLDETEIRPGFKIHIEPAQFTPKESTEKKDKPAIVGTKRKKIKPVVDQSRNLQWGFTTDSRFEGRPRIVILKHMFHPDDFSNDPLLKQDLKEDITLECKKFGHVEKVRIFEDHPEGVVEVKFQIPTAAEDCIAKLNGRFFGGRTVEATMWDYKTKYNEVRETIEDMERRHKEFGKLLNDQDANSDEDDQ
jgi:HIV Tat-specific factor 1